MADGWSVNDKEDPYRSKCGRMPAPLGHISGCPIQGESADDNGQAEERYGTIEARGQGNRHSPKAAGLHPLVDRCDAVEREAKLRHDNKKTLTRIHRSALPNPRTVHPEGLQ